MAQKKYTTNTPIFRGRFMNVLSPREQKDDDGNITQQWACTALFKKGEDLKDIKKLATELMTDKFGPDVSKWPKPRSEANPRGWSKPWRDQWEKDPKNEDADKTYEGYEGGALYLNLKSNKAPDVVLQNPEVKAMAKDIYDGAFYISHIELFWYGDNPSSKGNKGIGVSLHCVQKVEEGEPLAGSQVKAASVFKPVAVDPSKGSDAIFDGGDADPMA